MFEKIAQMLSEQLGIDPKSITMESRFYEDLNADSFNMMALVMDLETQFNIEVSDDILTGMRTVGDIVRFMEESTR